MFTDSSSIRRKEKHERPPSAKPPVELVVLAGLRFLPFVPTQPRLFQLRFRQRFQINEMFQVPSLLPAADLSGFSVPNRGSDHKRVRDNRDTAPRCNPPPP